MKQFDARRVRALAIVGICVGMSLTEGGLPSRSIAVSAEAGHPIAGVVQNQDLRRVPSAIVEVKDQEGTLVAEAVTNDAGEFSVLVPKAGTYSVSAVQETYRSAYIVLRIGKEPPQPVTLTLELTQELALEIVSPLPPIQYKASSETYSISRKDIEILPRGNNADLQDVLATIPSAIQQPLKQVNIRQEHANLQIRIDGVPIPETVTGTFSDVITPRAWERADLILGGLEAQYGWRNAAVLDITSKSGTKPAFGSIQVFGGSNESVNPSFEYGGTVGEKFRYYVLNSFTTTNRGIEPPTLGKTNFHDQNERNQTYLRGDYQRDNRNNFTWLFLNSVAKYQIPTNPNLPMNGTILGLLRARQPGFTPAVSQALDENQYESNQYGHMVWRHDVDASNYFSLAGYIRQTRGTFKTDPFNVLAYTPDEAEPFSAADQDRLGASAGMRLDYTYARSRRHLIKAGVQVDRSQAINKTKLFAFQRDPATAAPTGAVIERSGDNRLIGYREEVWVQDQWTPNERWTFNLGVRGDLIQYQYTEGQISPRLGATYKADQNHVFHAYYGMLFTPPNLERIPFTALNVLGTTAQPENLANNKTRAERAHYWEVGSYHALGRRATLEITGYYKLARYLGDAGQFGTTPMLNYFAFERGWTRGIEGALKVQATEQLSGRGNVAWGQCKGYGLQSGQILLEQREIDDIGSSGGVFCDHSQFMSSSAVINYRLLERTAVSGQMLYGSGLRTADPGAKTNSTNVPSYTVYNLSLTHEIPLTKTQKFLLGFDVINLLDQQYVFNRGEGSIGLGVAHAGMPRSFFFRGQWFF
jgi:hypothetical protein